MYQANQALHYFILNNWHFKNDRFMELCTHLKLEDLKSFNFTDFVEFDLVLYFRYAVWGGRKYLLGEKDSTIEYSKRKYHRMKTVDAFLKAVLFTSILWLVFIKYDFFGTTRLLCYVANFYRA
jgi:hypothetical protein